MTNYRSTEESLVLSPRMEKVHADILPRLRDRFSRENTDTAEMGPDGKNPFLDVFVENPDAPYVICLAKAIVRSWLVTPVLIHKDEAIVGTTRPAYPIREHFSWGIQGCDSYIIEADSVEERRKKALAMARMNPHTGEYLYHSAKTLYGKEKLDEMYANRVLKAGGYQGHTIPNYVTLLENGLDGMLEKINYYADKNRINRKGEDTSDFYEANRIIVRGMSAFLQQYADKAAELAAAEADAEQKKFYEQIAENCAFVAHKKPYS